MGFSQEPLVPEQMSTGCWLASNPGAEHHDCERVELHQQAAPSIPQLLSVVRVWFAAVTMPPWINQGNTQKLCMPLRPRYLLQISEQYADVRARRQFELRDGTVRATWG